MPKQPAASPHYRYSTVYGCLKTTGPLVFSPSIPQVSASSGAINHQSGRTQKTYKTINSVCQHSACKRACASPVILKIHNFHQILYCNISAITFSKFFVLRFILKPKFLPIQCNNFHHIQIRFFVIIPNDQ